jgi:hypothetical protein
MGRERRRGPEKHKYPHLLVSNLNFLITSSDSQTIKTINSNSLSTSFSNPPNPTKQSSKMQFTTAIVTILSFTTFVAAAPRSHINARNPFPANDLAAAAQSELDAKVAAGCDLLKCLAALAPEAATCAAALAEEGLNPLADAACFAAALNNAANPVSKSFSGIQVLMSTC